MTNWATTYGSGGGDGSSSGSGGGGWAGVYGGSSGGGGVAKKSGGGGGFFGGLEGLVGNLGSDVGSTITGLPRGLEGLGSQAIHTFSPSGLKQNIGISPLDSILHSLHLANPNPGPKTFLQDTKGLGGGTVKPFVEQERHIYGSALHGNFHPLFQHPLQPILDAATVATLGGVGAARLAEAGKLGGTAGRVARAGRTLKSGDLSEPLNTARTLQGRALQQKFDRYSMANPDKAIVGANSRLARIASVRSIRLMSRARMPARDFQRVTASLTKDERFAFHVGAEGVPLSDRIAFYRQQLAEAPTPHLRDYVHRLESPGVAKVLAEPRPQFTAALHAGKELEAKAGQNLVDAGQLTRETRTDRALLPQDVMRPGQAAPVTGNLVHPDFPSAYRFPHIGTEAEKPGLFTAPSATSGLREPRTPGFLRRNEAVRLRTARLMTNPEVLTQDFLATMRHEHLLNLRERVLRPVSKPLDPALERTGGKAIDEHYFFDKRSTRVPRNVSQQQNLSQDLGVLDEHGRETSLAHQANQTVFTHADMPEELRGKSIQQLNDMGVRRVPKAFAEKYRSNFAATGKMMRLFVDRPLDVWRAITLNARPAWMVNNLVGNAAQYAMRYAGVDGAAAYLRVLLHTEHGDAKVRQIMGFTLSHPTLRRKYGRIFDEVAPELHGAGLYSSNTNITRGGVYQGVLDRAAANRAGRAIGFGAHWTAAPIKAVGRVITGLERHFAEAVPREAAMLREVEPMLIKLGRANQSVEAALKSLSPREVELAIDRVNDYMGDFNATGKAERRVVKRLIPFESWYRVIVQVSAKLAFHYPGRINLLHSIAQAYTADDQTLPSWLKGALEIGGVSKAGNQTMITTQGLNPYETIPQLANQNPIGLFNPAFQAGAVGATGVDPFTQGAYRGIGAGTGNDPGTALKRGLGSLVEGLVPTRLAEQTVGTPTSSLYAPHTYGQFVPVKLNDYLLSYLGLPIRHVNRVRAKSYAQEGR